MAEVEPQFASEYDDRATAAVKSVLVEIGQILGFPGGVDALVAATKPLLHFETARTGYLHVSEKFRHLDDFGPTRVRRFIDRPDLLGERTADQWQQDAFGQVDAWLSGLGLR